MVKKTMLSKIKSPYLLLLAVIFIFLSIPSAFSEDWFKYAEKYEKLYNENPGDDFARKQASSGYNNYAATMESTDYEKIISYYDRAIELDIDNLLAMKNKIITYLNWAIYLAKKENFDSSLEKIAIAEALEKGNNLKLNVIKTKQSIIDRRRAITQRENYYSMNDIPVTGKIETMKEYIKYVHSLCSMKWNLKNTGTKGKTVLSFDIKRDGTIENIQVKESSGIDPFDKLAMSVLEGMDHFLPVPDEYERDIMKSEIVFETDHENLHNAFINKHKNNPMKWQYKPRYGHYAKLMIDEESNPDFVHFYKFPIKYWVQPIEGNWQVPVEEAIKEFSNYFPMQSVKKKRKADLIIQFVDQEKYNRVNKSGDKNSIACGGFEMKVETRQDRKILTDYRGNVYTLYSSMSYPHITKVIMHELGHAFGVVVHSDNPEDVMYYSDTLHVTPEGDVEHAQKEFRLSNRDLNTLFILYNNWSE
jgi:TonB family protein